MSEDVDRYISISRDEGQNKGNLVWKVTPMHFPLFACHSQRPLMQSRTKCTEKALWNRFNGACGHHNGAPASSQQVSAKRAKSRRNGGECYR